MEQLVDDAMTSIRQHNVDVLGNVLAFLRSEYLRSLYAMLAVHTLPKSFHQMFHSVCRNHHSINKS